MDDLPPHDNENVHESAPGGDWLEQAEARVLDAAVALAGEMGWSDRLADAALREAQLNSRDRRLVIPHGARDLVALLSRRHDRRALAALARIDASALKVRERIHAAVQARVEVAMKDEAAVRRANGFLALPLNTSLALRLAWESADHLWRWAGDTATDENHYSKRAILSGVLITTLAARLRGGPGEANAQLGRRIDQVMGFETWKAKLPKPAQAGESLAAWLGKVRYAARDKAGMAPEPPPGARTPRGAEVLPPPDA